MSSNIQIEKTCEHCYQLYTARTLHTRYCSHICNRKAYKANKRAEKLQGYFDSQDNIEKDRKVSARADLRHIEYLNITEVCALLSLSRGTIFRWIKEGVLVTYQHRQKHIIHRKEIEKIFNYESKDSSSKSGRKTSPEEITKR